MSIDKHYQFLDTRLFKAFLAAAEEENFTTAALAAYMTQSGISQHIAKLESHLGVPLFKRVGKRVTLTEAGRMLAVFIRMQANHTESLLDTVRDWSKSMSGLVAYAMPASCLLSPHFGMMLEKRKRYPDIRVNVTLAPSDNVVGMLLEGKVDFGFVTRLYDQPSLDFKLFCQEEYILVSADPAEFASLDAQSMLQKPFIIYPGLDVYYSHWSKHFLAGQPIPEFTHLRSTGNFSSIEGAIKMVEGGLGITIFPRHCVMAQLDAGTLFAFQPGIAPLMNDIYIVTVKDFVYPRVVTQLLDWFFEMHCGEHTDPVAEKSYSTSPIS